MQKNIDQTEKFILDNAAIDKASELVQFFLADSGTPAKEITRCRLSVEEVLGA